MATLGSLYRRIETAPAVKRYAAMRIFGGFLVKTAQGYVVFVLPAYVAVGLTSYHAALIRLLQYSRFTAFTMSQMFLTVCVPHNPQPCALHRLPRQTHSPRLS